VSQEPPVTASVLSAPPARVHRSDIVVMEQTAADELPVKPGDRPEEPGLRTGVLPGGWYRPLVEFHRRHGHIERWLPVEEHA
jgi:hypothetical protein